MYKVKPFILVLVVIFAALIYYFFSFLIPFTDNGFTMNNITPIAADVSGYITEIYVKNEQRVKKGDPFFTVFKDPYELSYKQLTEELNTAKSSLMSLRQKLARDRELYNQYKQEYGKINLDFERNNKALQFGAVSEIDVKNLEFDKNSSLAKLRAQEQQISMDQQDIITEEHKIKNLEYKTDEAKVYLDQTTVYAMNDGIVQNMYLSKGAPIEIHKPLFSFIDIDNIYIQANFTEIDLRKVRPMDKVYIIPRMYFGSKIYHGTIVSKSWAANRQITNDRSQLQQVTNNENNWVLLPQRLPVQIKITDYDPNKYPLPVGSSCYVFIAVKW